MYVHVAPHALFMEQSWLQDYVNVRTFKRKMFRSYGVVRSRTGLQPDLCVINGSFNKLSARGT